MNDPARAPTRRVTVSGALAALALLAVIVLALLFIERTPSAELRPASGTAGAMSAASEPPAER